MQNVVSKKVFERSNKHLVTKREIGNKRVYYTIKSDNGKEHHVAIEVSCDCEWASMRGSFPLCSHALTAIKYLYAEAIGNEQTRKAQPEEGNDKQVGKSTE